MQLVVDGHPVHAYTGTRPPRAAQPTIVFVHGAANDHSVWALQSRYFAWHGCNVLAVDLPGHGKSGGVALASVEAIAAWLIALLDAAGVARATLVGHSLGALAVLDVARQAPSRLARLALLGPAVPMAVSDELLAAAREDAPLAY
ncbi:MAG: alpha/beta fold hydrolase, partial [Proteobacteria bacterium]|nr:alpha/beta fold hydrolase [Pseudomonadota bacterium]